MALLSFFIGVSWPPLWLAQEPFLRTRRLSQLLLVDGDRRHHGCASAAELGRNSRDSAKARFQQPTEAEMPLPVWLGLFMLKQSSSRMLRIRPCAIAPSVSAGAA